MGDIYSYENLLLIKAKQRRDRAIKYATCEEENIFTSEFLAKPTVKQIDFTKASATH